MSEEHGENWVRLGDVPVGTMVTIKGLTLSMVRVLGKNSDIPRNMIGVDARRLCENGPIRMVFPKKFLCRAINNEDIEQIRWLPVQPTELRTR